MPGRRIDLPLTKEVIKELHAGDPVLLNGTVYVARDMAHQRMNALLDEGKELPFPIEGATVYYMGPTPARPGQIIGAAGPTTAGRMDAYTPRLLDLGLCGMIGKGRRSPEVIEAVRKNGAVYFGAIGGAGALISKCIKSARVIAMEDLGPEAVFKIEVEDFPAVVILDPYGNNLYETKE